jgi:AraC-like DNA-binding protein
MNGIDISDIVIREILSLITIRLKKGDIVQMINRSRTGLIFVSAGKIIYKMNNKHYLSDPDHALLLPRGANYFLESITDSESLLIDFSTVIPIDYPEIVSFKLNSSSLFLNYFHQIDKIWTFKKNSYKLKCLTGLYDILAKLNDLTLMPYTPDYKFAQIEPSINYLESHYGDPELSNEVLAEKSNISTVYFRKLFSEKYGVPPMKYVQNRRIDKASEMLLGNYSTVTDIAYSVGFKSINHFSRVFKKATGHSPREYKRLNLQENIHTPTFIF